jgi:hypothetical protein
MKRILIMPVIIFLFSMLYSNVVHGKNMQATSKVVLECNWGSGPGEIGRVETDIEPTAAGTSVNPIAVDTKGAIYIGDSINHRVLKFGQKNRLLSVFTLPADASNIESIFIDVKSSVYVLTKLNEKLVRYLPNGNIDLSVDLSHIGLLEKDQKGNIVLNKDASFSGSRYKVHVDSENHVFILGGDNLIRLDRKGEILKRWGPYVFDFIIDNSNILTVFYGSKYEQYDQKFNLINVGDLYKDSKFIGKPWNLIREPEYIDSFGCVYGITESHDNFLGRFCPKENKIYRLPIKQDDIIYEKWNIDNKGNVYYTASGSSKFKVIKAWAE